jgi:hypothetical protein
MTRVALLPLVATLALAGCSGSESGTSTAAEAGPLLTQPRPRADVALDGRVFERRGVEACVGEAWSSGGSFLVEAGPNPRWGIQAQRGVISVNLLPTDVAIRGPILGFTADAAGLERLERAIQAASIEPGSPFPARAIVVRRRGNVVFFYQRGVPRDTVAVTESCLGGPAWHPPPGPRPESGFPIG